MRVGLFSTMQMPSGRPDTPLRFIDRAVLAEQLGFESVWLAERHFTGYGIIGNPVVVAAAIAMRTTALRIGFAALILGQHNPWQLAEELTMLDRLSNGRIIVGMGSGRSMVEFGALGLSREDMQTRFNEIVQIMLKVWEGAPFDHAEGYYPGVFPGSEFVPVQRPHPALVRAIVHDDSVVAAAKLGVPILFGRFEPSALKRQLDIYTDTLAGDGKDNATIAALLAESGLLRHVVVADTNQQAERIAKDGLASYVARAMEVHEPHDPDDFYRQAFVVGTPETVLERLAGERELGLGRLLCWTDFGGIDPAVADETVRRIGGEVRPLLAVDHALN